MDIKPTSEIKFIVDTPFPGSAQTVIVDGKLAYTNLSLEEYLKEKPNFRILSEDEFNIEHTQYWVTSFKEITEEEWWSYYEQLPPVKPRTIQKRYFVDFCSEAYSGAIHSIYFIDNKVKKYYTCRMNIFATDDAIVEKFNNEIDPK